MSAPRSILALAGLAAALGACGVIGGDEANVDSLPPATPVPTISGVGVLPDTVQAARHPIIRVSRPVNEDGTTADLIGETSEGNRILIIGDSIIAGTTSRYGGELCTELVPLGWEAQVEAEPSRFIEFGNKVLDELLDPDPVPGDDVWDAAVVFLGSNYRGDPVEYEAELREILDRLAPRPTLLFTVTEIMPDWAEVNVVVAELGAEYENVTIIDWEEVAQTPGVISGDGQHPTDAGRQVLADLIAVALGPGNFGEGECLKSEFTDDSAVKGASVLESSSGDSSSGSSSGGTTRPSVTTVAPTVPAVTTTFPPSTDPPVTDPPSTDPPVTDPPSTDPPVTDPPSTDPTVPAVTTTFPPSTDPPVTTNP